MSTVFGTGGSPIMSLQLVAVRARKRTVFLVAALVTMLPLVGLTDATPGQRRRPDPVPRGHHQRVPATGSRTPCGSRPPPQAGDTLVLFMTTNSLSGTLGNPAGWTLLQGKDGTATRGRAWTKQATAADANATGHRHLDDHDQGHDECGRLPQQRWHLVGHRLGPDRQAPPRSTTHTTPSVAVAQAGSWLVNSWSEKSSHDADLDQARQLARRAPTRPPPAAARSAP